MIENKTFYKLNEIMGIAERENNTKRKYVIVNNKQAKHIPVLPNEALGLFKLLAMEVKEKYEGEKIVVIGFAETATAVGAAVSAFFGKNALFLTTTREFIEKKYIIAEFKEEHSHATEQALFCKDEIAFFNMADRIVFVEDEISTGKTILNFINELNNNKILGEKKYSAASLINSMSDENFKIYEGKNIDCLYLIKVLNDFTNPCFNGSIISDTEKDNIKNTDYEYYEFGGKADPRTGVNAMKYLNSCIELSNNIIKNIKKNDFEYKNILVLGTEEFMFPAIFLADKIYGLCKNCRVYTHSTTRSPIVPRNFENYPIINRTRLESIYEQGRKTYIYNLKKYDKVIVLTDAENINYAGVDDLTRALFSYGSKNITFIRWVR